MPKEVPKSETLRLKRAYDLVLEADRVEDKTANRKRKRGDAAGRKVSAAHLWPVWELWHGKELGVAAAAKGNEVQAMRRRWRKGKQGRPYKCAPLHEALFDWFVDVRFAVSTSLGIPYLMSIARYVADKLVKEMRQKRRSKMSPIPIGFDETG